LEENRGDQEANWRYPRPKEEERGESLEGKFIFGHHLKSCIININQFN
jgi:hypothetical protein